jgi:hypothetical protein
MLKKKEPYKELGGDYLLNLRKKRAESSLKKKLESLGYEVTKKVI